MHFTNLYLFFISGGIEQLEKHLKLQEDGTTSAQLGITTPATISKSLYEKVLSGPPNTLYKRTNQRPQYTSISRQRPQATSTNPQEAEHAEEEASSKPATFSRFRGQGSSLDDENDPSTKRPGAPEYVTIRRNRPSTTTTEGDGLEYVTIRRGNRPQEETTTSKYVV